MIGLGGAALLLPLAEPLQVGPIGIKFSPTYQLLGRSLELSQGIRPGVGFIFLVGAFLFAGGAVADPGRYYFSMGVFAVGLLVASLMVEPYLYAAIMLQLASAAMVLVLASPDRHAERAGLRLLAFTSMAMMALLIGYWIIEQAGVTASTPEATRRLLPFLALGLAILLLVPPFHLWLPPAADRAHPYAWVTVVALTQSAALFLTLRVFVLYPWLAGDSTVRTAITAAGVVMIVVGILWALAQSTMARMMTFLLLIDLGIGLLALAGSSQASLQLSVGMAASRVVSLGAWSMAMCRFATHDRDDHIESLRGAGRPHPWESAIALLGAFSLVGFPLTVGFPGRWGLGLALFSSGDPSGWALALGVAGGTVACLHWVGILFGGEGTAPAIRPRGRGLFYLLGAAVLLVVLGVFPQLLYAWAGDVVAGLLAFVGS
jgi:formate hydrogenlyase subunit 3/multisubunit Na+/H+ antiporter MnhD subunit